MTKQTQSQEMVLKIQLFMWKSLWALLKGSECFPFYTDLLKVQKFNRIENFILIHLGFEKSSVKLNMCVCVCVCVCVLLTGIVVLSLVFGFRK
jgi:hypothetical protein